MSIERASLLYQTGRFDMAEQEYRSALVADPSSALAHAMLGLCLLQSKKYAEATDEARQAVGLRPDWYIGYSVLAAILSERERVKDAVVAIGKAIELNPFDPNLHGTLARIRLKQRKWPSALEAADAGLAIDPEHAACVNARGIALVNLGRSDEAGVTIQGALGRNPHDAVTHANQGWALLHAGEHKAALIHFRESLRIDPDLQWAKAGIVEAMKARNIIYRVMLRYFLFMSRLGRNVQFAIVLGGFFGYKLLAQQAEAHPAIKPFATPVMVAYTIFAILTWLAGPLFNLMLRLDRFGRYALSRDQRVASNWVGSLLLAGVIMVGVGLAMFHQTNAAAAIIMAGIFTAVLSMSTAAVFSCDVGWPRYAMAAYTAGLAIAAATAIAFAPSLHAEVTDAMTKLHQWALNAFIYGLMLSAFIANALSATTVRR